MRIAVLIANGTEEIEVITPIDALRRGGAKVDVLSVNEDMLTCSHGVVIKADDLVSNADRDAYDGVVIPGGMPGATNVSQNEDAVNLIKSVKKRGKMVAAICASPAVVLAAHGLIEGLKATCYPAPEFIAALGESYTGKDVEVDNNVITANGPKAALEFSKAICEYLKLKWF